MSGDIRWISVPDRYIKATQLPGEGASTVVFASVVDVLSAIDRPEDLRDTLELLLARQAEHGKASGQVQHVRAKTLWQCSLGYWTCVVLAKTEGAARARAQQLWDESEGYESEHEWLIVESELSGGAVIGYV